MKTHKFKIIIVLIIFLMLVIAVYINAKTSKYTNPNKFAVEFILTPENDKYLKKQDIWLHAKIVNNTDNSFKLNSTFNWGNMEFDITEPDGQKVLKLFDNTQLPSISDSSEIASNSFQETDIELGYYFPQGTKKLGVYKLTATFQSLKSNEIEFEVKEPDGIDKEVFDKMKDAIGSPSENNYFQNSTRRLEDLLSQYPESKYAPQLYNYLFSELNYTNKSETDVTRLDTDFNNYITHNANSLGTNFIIHQYVVGISLFGQLDKKEIIRKLELVTSSHHETRAEKIINDYILSRLNK